MDPEVTKIMSEYEEFIYKQRGNDDICISITKPQSQVKQSTISYLNSNGYTCKLFGIEGYEYIWGITKDSLRSNFLHCGNVCSHSCSHNCSHSCNHDYSGCHQQQ